MPPETFTPPDWVPILVEAWRPLLAQLDEAMAASVRPEMQIANVCETTACVLSRLDYSLERLNSLISRDFATMLQSPDALVIARATGKFEAVLESLASILREVRRLDARSDDVLPKNLLAGVILHTLREIRDWLSQFLEALSDLRATLEKNGQALEGRAELAFNLKLTPAPQLKQLLNILQQRADSNSEEEEILLALLGAPHTPPPQPRAGDFKWIQRNSNTAWRPPASNFGDKPATAWLDVFAVLITLSLFVILPGWVWIVLWFLLAAIGYFIWLFRPASK